MNVVWTYVLGPLLALLPARWRNAPWWRGQVNWERAGTVSGILQMLGAVVGMGYWYIYEMTRRIGQIVDMAVVGKIEPGLEEHQVRGAALMLLYMSPLTWLLFYFFAEGAVRMCAAAFTEKSYGSLPLWAAERLWKTIRRPNEARISETIRENAKSFTESIRERVMLARIAELEDEVRFEQMGTEGTLEIRASRRKLEWAPPRIVKVDDSYYRLEAAELRSGARPFVYRLRRLEAGVMGRRVIQYQIR
jgi:hypothetical protein